MDFNSYGIFNVDWKICIGCGSPFFAKDISPTTLKIKKFKNFKRCPDCRYRDNIRTKNSKAPASYYKKVNRVLNTLDPYERLIYEIGKRDKHFLLSVEVEHLLCSKLTDGTITGEEKLDLQHHFEYVIFFLGFRIKVPSLSYTEISELDKDILRLLFY